MSEKQQAWKRNADAQWQAIYALVPAYRAALAVHNVDFIALNAAVEVHHRALMALKHAEHQLALQHAEHQIEHSDGALWARAEGTGDETDDETGDILGSDEGGDERGLAEAEALWQSQKTEAMRQLPKQGETYETKDCTVLHSILPGTWASINANRGGRTWNTDIDTPAWILQKKGSSSCYVWTHWSTGEGVFLVNNTALKGLPAPLPHHQQPTPRSVTAKTQQQELQEARERWDDAKDEAPRKLPRYLPLREELPAEVCNVHARTLFPGVWVLASADHSRDGADGTFGAAADRFVPVYVLLESNDAGFFYVYGEWRNGQGVYRVQREELRARPNAQRVTDFLDQDQNLMRH